MAGSEKLIMSSFRSRLNERPLSMNSKDFGNDWIVGDSGHRIVSA